MNRVRALTSRPWAGPDDLRAMTAAMSRAWNGPRRPLVPGTPGDLEWWTAQGGPDADWPNRIRIWEMGDEVVGWGWFKPPSSLDWFVADVSAEEDAAIRDDILDWHRLLGLRHVRDEIQAGRTEATEEPLDAWAGDGWSEAAHLERRGWTPTDSLLTQYHQALDREIELPPLPPGYAVRGLRGPAEITARVEVHRAAFAPSKLTFEKYEILLLQEHYALERDVVVEAPDGSLAAFTIAWADPVGSIGELEPVGTHPDHQRRGLGRVVTSESLRRLRAAGMREAIVFSDRSNTASEALYQAVGFREVAIHRQWTKPLRESGAQSTP